MREYRALGLGSSVARRLERQSVYRARVMRPYGWEGPARSDREFRRLNRCPDFLCCALIGLMLPSAEHMHLRFEAGQIDVIGSSGESAVFCRQTRA